MASKDLFERPFDEGTLVKLEIFEKYFKEWLPTFINGEINKPIRVFDLFAGVGYDKNKVPGSPIRILQIISKYASSLREKNKKVFLYLNDLDETKKEKLEENVKNKIKELSLKDVVDFNTSSKDFKDCLLDYENDLRNGCNLIFIDQNGFKEVDERVFQFLIKLEKTEFIFFISSSYIRRFAGGEEVRRYHPKFDFDKIKNAHRKQVHNIICEEFYKYVPSDITNYGLFPFSIMKSDNNNVYGIIFVTKHIRGAEKFLKVVWQKNPINGNANFDIDDDLTKSQLHIFGGKIPTKIEKFQYDLRDKILKGEIRTNEDAYIYTINRGHIPKHAADEIKRMKNQKLIKYNARFPLLSYEEIFKKRRIINYEVLK